MTNDEPQAVRSLNLTEERAVALTHQMYECRRVTRAFFGADYPQRIGEYTTVITRVATEKKMRPLEAALALSKEAQGNGYTQLFLLAAYVELAERGEASPHRLGTPMTIDSTVVTDRFDPETRPGVVNEISLELDHLVASRERALVELADAYEAIILMYLDRLRQVAREQQITLRGAWQHLTGALAAVPGESIRLDAAYLTHIESLTPRQRRVDRSAP